MLLFSQGSKNYRDRCCDHVISEYQVYVDGHSLEISSDMINLGVNRGFLKSMLRPTLMKMISILNFDRCTKGTLIYKIQEVDQILLSLRNLFFNHGPKPSSSLYFLMGFFLYPSYILKCETLFGKIDTNGSMGREEFVSKDRTSILIL